MKKLVEVQLKKMLNSKNDLTVKQFKALLYFCKRFFDKKTYVKLRIGKSWTYKYFNKNVDVYNDYFNVRDIIDIFAGILFNSHIDYNLICDIRCYGELFLIALNSSGRYDIGNLKEKYYHVYNKYLHDSFKYFKHI